MLITETNTAIATATTTLQTQLNGFSTSITELQTTQNGVDATYGIRVNNNGHVSGFGLISQLRNGQPVSDFVISDASFRVVNSSGVGVYTPFAVYPTGRMVDGAFVPPGVHAQDFYVMRANIAELAVTNAQIEFLTVGGEKIQNGAASAAAAAYGAPVNVGTSDWVNICSVTIGTIGGRGMIINALASLVSGSGGQGSPGGGRVRLLANGLNVQETADYAVSEEIPLMALITTGTGSITLTIQAIKTSGDGNFIVSARVFGMEMRK